MPCACIGACACLAATSALSGLLGYYFYDMINCMEKECYDSLVVDAIVIDKNKSMSLYYDAKA